MVSEKVYSERDNEVEFSLEDLLWELAMQWKVILACMLVCGLVAVPLLSSVAAGILNRTEERTEVASAAFQQNNSLENSGLTEVEKGQLNKADLAYRKVLALQQVFDLDGRYSMDMDNIHVRRLQYWINAENESAMSTIREAYIEHFASVEVVKDVARIYGFENEDVRNLLSIWVGNDNAGSHSLYWGLYFDDSMDEERIKEAIKDKIESYRDTLIKKLGNFELELVTEEYRIGADQALINGRSNALQQIVDAKNALLTQYEDFSEIQQEVFRQQVKRINEENGIADEDAPMNFEVAVTEVKGIVGLSQRPHKNRIFFALGAAFALLVYVLAYIVYWLVAPRVRRVDEFIGTMGVRAVGEIRQYPASGLWGAFCRSKLIYNMRYRGRMDAEKSLTEIVERISLLVEEGEELLLTVPTPLGSGKRAFLDRIIQKSDRKLVPIDADETKSVALEEKLVKKPKVVLVSAAGETALKDAWDIHNACRNYGTRVMGHILIQA
ncbi:MAG: hypothetical protein IJV04_10680 [Lachnospiraceae bacterium]|nr:hypothetical protein [Lachnospiraceae bacterium]